MTIDFEFESAIEANTQEMPVIVKGKYDPDTREVEEWWVEVKVDGEYYDIYDRLTEDEIATLEAKVNEYIHEEQER